jgi:hypothetical protein
MHQVDTRRSHWWLDYISNRTWRGLLMNKQVPPFHFDNFHLQVHGQATTAAAAQAAVSDEVFTYTSAALPLEWAAVFGIKPFIKTRGADRRASPGILCWWCQKPRLPMLLLVGIGKLV